MRFTVFCSGAAILALGWEATRVLETSVAMAFLQGSLTLGGGIIICGLFSLKMRSHGIIGAAILALLGIVRGLANLPGFIKFVTGDRHSGSAPVLEMGVVLVCCWLVLRVGCFLHVERRRRMLEQSSDDGCPPRPH